jgi:nondiscriminating glutamyl-tRNA synthetase
MKNIENQENQEIRVRFAPSPTGTMHIGNLRTALFTWLFARNQNGKFLVRIEDTDQKRLDKEATKKIFETLDWVEMDVDEGVYLENEKIKQKGDFGPYIQSERLDVYKKYTQELLDKGLAYYCFCSAERLEKVREKQRAEKIPPMYDKKCRDLKPEEVQKKIEAGEKFVIRMKVPTDEKIYFEDKVFGKIEVDSNTVDDQVLIKTDGFPTYHFAVVVDDHLMEISHIFRGEEWLPSTPKHVLLYKFFGWKVPKFVHLPNVLGENKKKLSKRQGDVSVGDFKEKGYLPEALINFLSLLGWNPKSNQEIMSREELIKNFSLNGLHKAGAIFNYQKLDWINAQYIKKQDDEKLFKIVEKFFDEYLKENNFEKDLEKLKKIVRVEKTRIKNLSEIKENLDIYFKDVQYPKNMLIWKDMTVEGLRKVLQKDLELISGGDLEDPEIFQKTVLDNIGEARGEHLWPMRVALSGQEKSASPFELAWILGKEESEKRIKDAIRKI